MKAGLASVLALVVACGGKKEEAPKAQVREEIVQPATVLGEAARLAASEPRDPVVVALLAYAQTTAKHPDARATLDAALVAARADKTSRGTEGLVHAAAVIALSDPAAADKLLDEAVLRMHANVDGDLVVRLLSESNLETGLERVAKFAIATTSIDFETISFELRADSRGFAALASAVRAISVATDRADHGWSLVTQARRCGRPDLAKELLATVLPAAKDNTAAVPAGEIAGEAALLGDAAAAAQIAARIETATHADGIGRRALVLANLAHIYAVAGDRARSQAAEKLAVSALDADGAALDPGDDEGGEIGDSVWASLVAARFARDDAKAALALAEKHVTANLRADLAYMLFDYGVREPLEQMLAPLGDTEKRAAIGDLVELESWADLDAAKRRALAARASGPAPGIEYVLQGYAVTGNLAAIDDLEQQQVAGPDVAFERYVAIAARELAHQGKCGEAVAAVKRVAKARAETVAAIARHCPNTKLD